MQQTLDSTRPWKDVGRLRINTNGDGGEGTISEEDGRRRTLEAEAEEQAPDTGKA
jgi:hypothetical protein